MKTVCTAILLLGWGRPMVAQNLVPNAGFEEHTECPDNLDQIERAAGWTKFRGSPDYYNACDTNGLTGVPQNLLGYQVAHTGSAYCGALTYGTTAYNIREHIAAELTQTLIPGLPVTVSFCYSVTTNPYTASGIGLGFSVNPYFVDGQVPLPDRSAIVVDSLVYDTNSWHCVQAEYLPDSAYRYVIVGGLYDDSLIQVGDLNVNSGGSSAYVYFDDVCVSYGMDNCLLVNTMREQQMTIKAYPNPYRDFVNIQLADWGVISMRVRDQLGKELWERAFLNTGGLLRMDLSDLPYGPMALVIENAKGYIGSVTLIHSP